MNLFMKLNYQLGTWYAKEPTSYTRTIYVYLVNLLCNLINIMHSTNEVKSFFFMNFCTMKIYLISILKTSLLLPNELNETIFHIVNDICLNETNESCVDLLLPLLSHLDAKLYDVYFLSNRICESLSSACNFLTSFDELVITFKIQMVYKS